MTSVVYEYPCAEGDPYYPVPRPENAELYKQYKMLADATPHVHFAGRLGTYKYYNMDQVVAQALMLFNRIATKPIPEPISLTLSISAAPLHDTSGMYTTGSIGAFVAIPNDIHSSKQVGHLKEDVVRQEGRARDQLQQRELGQGGEDSRIRPPRLSLVAIAQSVLEKDDRVLVGKTYSVQAGISQNKPEGFEEEPSDLLEHDARGPLSFDILLHASENIKVTTEWQKHLNYDPHHPNSQLVEFTFITTKQGPNWLDINFYCERLWLRTVHFEINAVGNLYPTVISSEE
jgi:hypothetical protein